MWEYTQGTSEDVARKRRLYEPLTASVRELIEATLRTEVDDDAVASAQADIEAATATLRHRQREGSLGVEVTPEGESVAWGNVAVGSRNPLAPPLLVEYESPGRAHLDVHLGAAYEGPPGHLHGGYGALVLDHLLGALASHDDPARAAATGTISFRYERLTRLGDLHAEAEIQSTDGRKILVVGHIADAEGVTISAEGVFITLMR